MIANINIRTNDIDTIINAINTNENKKGLQQFYVGSLADGWITLLSDHFDWDDVKEYSVSLSNKITFPILSYGNFIDEVIMITLVRDGKILTELIHCENAHEYGIKSNNIDTDLLIKELGLPLISEQIKTILENEFLDIEELEELLYVPLTLKFDHVYEDEELREKFKHVIIPA